MSTQRQQADITLSDGMLIALMSLRRLDDSPTVARIQTDVDTRHVESRDRSTIQRWLDQCHQNGLVNRIPDNGQYRYHLTPTGDTVLNRELGGKGGDPQ